MKTFHNIKFNFFTGLLISTLLFAAVFPFIKQETKYSLSISKNLLEDSNNIIIYKDLYHDGTSEKLLIIRNFEGRLAILVFKNGRTLFEWNLQGKMELGDFLYTYDYNKDGVDEIYVFTHSHDSIFLNGYDVKNNSLCFSPLFLTKFKYFKGNNDVMVNEPQFRDLKHNGHKELIFSLYSGFSKSIRKVFAVNIKTGTIRTSPLAGTSISANLSYFDINHNGSDDITGTIYSHGNYSPDFPVSDSILWFYVYDADLQYLFKPIKLGHYPGKVFVFPFKTKSKNLLAVFVQSNTIKDSTFIALANGVGKILRYRIIPYNKSGNDYYFKVFPAGKKYRMALYNGDNGIIKYFSKDLKTVKTYQSFPFEDRIYSFDLEGDGQKEEVYFGRDMDHLVVSRYDFTNPVEIKFPGEVGNYYFSVRWENDKPQALCLNLPNHYYEFYYRKNGTYTYRYLIYLGIFLGIFLIVNLIGLYYQRHIKLRYKAEKRIQQNQLLAVETQLNPHFILGILNSIGSLYEKKETQLAGIYMGKYSKMLRDTLLASGQIAITLEQELSFVKNYLDLEKFRLNNRFDYIVSCDLKICSIQIPRLLIYTFIENALKHGIFPILGKEQAHIEIHCFDKGSYCMIDITDNGIGRNAAKKRKQYSTGKGLKILSETLQLYRSVYRQKIYFKMNDLNPGSKTPGTKVSIFISGHSRK